MTETSSAGTASNEHAFTQAIVNDDERVVVCGEVEQNAYYLKASEVVNEAVFKCSGCKHLAIHEGIEIQIRETTMDTEKRLRYYLCTICGTFRYKA